MHQHTAGCSACATISPEETVRQLKRQGFAGMVLTNHFFYGNTAIRRNLPWADFVRPYEEEWLRAKEMGDRLDFDVLFGLEEGVGGGKEVLLYGITPDWLYDHPELRDRYQTAEEHLAVVADIVHRAGGLVFQAHPFRVRDYITDPWQSLPADYLDGVEAYNFYNSPVENVRAEQYAHNNDLLTIAGTDAHHTDIPSRFGIATERRLRTDDDLTEALTTESYTLYLGE
ncbi:MAG: hypothetical protein IJ518_04905 [Clostridia bacterium]|nr:hypothetical protein [Clostridia bacterium]